MTERKVDTWLMGSVAVGRGRDMFQRSTRTLLILHYLVVQRKGGAITRGDASCSKVLIY